MSRVTVREALRDLVRENLLVKVQGKGTFVAPNLPKVLPPTDKVRSILLLPPSALPGDAPHAGEVHQSGSRVQAEQATMHALATHRRGPIALANQTGEEAHPGHLIVSKTLSSGRHSALFQAVDPLSQRQVALKTAAQGTDRTALAIVREAEVLSRLDHPNIARLIGLEYANGSAALLTEFVSGPTLDSQLASAFDRTAAQVVELIAQLCEAVSAVHRAGFVHGDISSRNIMVAPDNRLILIDFGESRPLDARSTPARATPDFAAPELFRGAPASITSDVYSVGVLGSLLMRSQIDRRPSPRTSHAAAAVRVPQESRSTLLDIIERATESDPSRRYATVEEVLSAVQRLAGPDTPQTTR